MILNILGFPGSGRHTFIENLNKYYKTVLYDDFNEIPIGSGDIEIHTIFGKKYFSTVETKLITIIFPTVFKRTDDERYSKFFGVDIEYLYNEDVFAHVGGIQNGPLYEENNEYFVQIGNFVYIKYDYNFEKFKIFFDKFYKEAYNMEKEIFTVLKQYPNAEKLFPFVFNN